MGLMNLNLDGVLTVEKVVVPADGITVLSHSLFRGEKITVRYNGDELTRGQDFIPDRIDDRLYFQKNICLFTALKILNESLFGQEIEVEYFACGDYINAEIWNEYPSSASLKQSLASKVDNSDFTKEMKRIDDDVNAEATARKEADNTLQDNINTETNLRIAEDENLQTNINNEATVRADADDTLQDNINAEAATRESADNEIRNELSSETNLRLVGDSNLQTQISDLKTKFESFVPGLTYKVVSSLPTADILNNVIYLVPADSTGSQSVYDEYLYIDGNWELIGTTATTQAITVDSALSETSTNPVQNKVIAVELKNMGRVYTSLAELGLTADATFQNVISALPKGGSALLGVTEFTNYQTIFPYEEGNDQFARVYIVKGLEDGSCMYARWFRKDGAKEAIAFFNINDNKFNGWQMLKNQQVYTSLKELGLDTTATINDIVIAMKNGTTFTYKTDVFDYATEYENLRYATVTIIKQTVGRVQIFMTDKNTGDLYIGKMSSDNKVDGWSKVQTEVEVIITSDIIAKYGTEILKYPIGTWRINNKNIGNQFTDLPLKDTGSVIEIDSIDPNRSPYEHSYGYRNYIFKASLDGIIYIRTLNSGDTAGTLQRDTGWKKVCTDETRLTTLETQVSELFQSVSNGKTLVANAITGKGVSTSTTATFATMATNIGKISGGYKEETKTLIVTSNTTGTQALPFTFSANVIAVKQIVAPSYDGSQGTCSIVTSTSKNIFSINGKEVTFYVRGTGRWEVTALVQA